MRDPVLQYLWDPGEVGERRGVYLLWGCERLVSVRHDLLMVDDVGPRVPLPDCTEEILPRIAVDGIGVDLLQFLFAAVDELILICAR